MRARLLAAAVSIVALPFVLAGAAQRTPPATRGDWPSYRGNLAGTGYSALAEIDRTTVTRLKRAWTFSLEAASGAQTSGAPAAAVNSQATPIVIGGSMYLPTADAVVALDAASGRPVWRTPVSGGAPSRRGLSYWPGDRTTGARIFVMSGRRLMALDARDGSPSAAFGNGGAVDIGVPYNSVPGIFRNVVVVGANNPPGTPGAIGNPRAYDARSGAKLWEFNSVAQPGEPGHDTWEGESWKGRLGANAWPFLGSPGTELEFAL